ncbi:unnamed protein product [Diatraea saccharalis]|uniref:Scavenger receptor class B member 1 n=1 Tax=Diatraea saccharalis TaxID=40085 RepID=A0A9N9RBS1_9NEOP|nr:unnamed protein product [Diatraea saccharalis]
MDHEHRNLENTSSTTLMLPKGSGEEKVVILTPNSNGVGKILIREDTILANLQGCAGCGKAKFTCSGVKNQWSVLCWGRQSDKKYYTLLVLLSTTFVLSLLGTIFFCFTNTINDAILSNMVIRNNTIAYSIWKRPNVQPHMKVHVFNYTNWREYRDGYAKKLHVVDTGPYVYTQQLERVNVVFDNDHVTYQEKNDFRFLANKSAGAQFDQVTVPNMPLLGLAKVLEQNLNPIAQFPVITAISFANHPEAFVQLPVHRFLWGYEDYIYNAAKPLLSLRGELKVNEFGLLAVKNDTLSEQFTINTGEIDMDKMNVIEKVEGKNSLNIWGGQDCNSIESTDGSIFPPSQLDRKKILHIFFPNLCRRLPFVYEKDVEIDGILLLRYRLPSNVFDDPTNNPENQCYCEIDSATCPPRGVINVTACTMGAPALASFPHFHLGDPKLRNLISGLKPDPEIHQNYLDIHPTLGIALRGKSSLQINMQVVKSNMISALGFLNQGLILPIAWVEMVVEDLPESLRTLIYHGTFSTAAIQLGLAVTSIAALFISGICLFVLLIGRRQKPCATLKIPIETEMKN